MTHPTEPRVEVTQADREAAADLFLHLDTEVTDFELAMASNIRAGNLDATHAVQWFARHRTAAEAANRAREDALVSLLTKAVGDIAAALELAGSAHLIGKWTADYVVAINAHDIRTAAEAANRESLRIGDKVRVIGEHEADWRGIDTWLTGINVDHEGLNYTIGEQWPVPHRHMTGYLGMTDGFREGELARAALSPTATGEGPQ